MYIDSSIFLQSDGLWQWVSDIFVIHFIRDSKDIATTVTMNQSHYIASIDVSNGSLDCKATADNVQRPHTLMEGG